MAGGELGNFYFCDQLVGNIFELSRGGALGLGDEIDGTVVLILNVPAVLSRLTRSTPLGAIA